MKRQLAMWRVKQFSVSERNTSGGLPNSSKAKEKPGESRDAFSTKDLTLYHQKWMKSLAVILPFILICCIPVIVHAHEKSHAARERLLSFDGELSLSNPPRIGERATLTLEISSKISNPRPIEVVFRLPDGLTAHSQSTFANQLLPLNTAQNYLVEIQVGQVGVYTIQASTYWTENGSTKAQHFYTYLAVNQNGSQVSKASIPPTYSQRLEPLRGKRLNRTLVDTQKVLVQGQIRYFDDNKRIELPIRHVGVRLLEQNTVQPDEEIGKTETDADGRYHFPEIDNTDPEDETKRDLYVIITFENSTLKLTSESTWIPLSIDANDTNGESLLAISFVNTMRGWVVGSGGTIMRTDNGGASWTAQNSGVTVTLVDVFFLNTDKGWIVGESGTVLHTTNGGDTWIPQQSNVVEYLNSIYFKTPNEGWAVGNMGVIVHTIDGGATWTFETSDVENDLINVSIIDDKGYIVGDWGIVLAMEQEPILLSLPTDFRAKPNETITLPITVNDTTGIGNGNITIAYNTNNVELLQATDATITLLTKDFNVVKDTTTPGELTITFSSATPLSAGSGALFNIVFHVNSNVAVGSSTTLTFKSVSIQNIPDPQTQDGMVTIIGTPGDLNNDDILDVRDAILALRQIKNLSTPNPVYEQSVSDVNGDGQLNEADVDHLLRQDVGLQ